MFSSPASRVRVLRKEANSSHKTYWTQMYHSLSPGAYVANTGVNQTWTVPAGKTWFMVNGWQISINGTAGLHYHRSCDSNTPLVLPAGSVVTTGAGGGQLYYFDPSLLSTPSDPEKAYYDRLAYLNTVPLQTITTTITAGAAANSQSTVSFPATFTNGILRGWSSFDLAWTIFEPIGFNFDFEVSDAHQMRFGRTLIVPFVRSVLTGVRVQGASISGDGVQTCLAGRSVVVFQPLPNNW